METYLRITCLILGIIALLIYIAPVVGGWFR